MSHNILVKYHLCNNSMKCFKCEQKIEILCHSDLILLYPIIYL